MITDQEVEIYKKEMKNRGFHKAKKVWFKKMDDVTLVFYIENLRPDGAYVPKIGVLLNRTMKRNYPLKSDTENWIVNFRVNAYNEFIPNPSEVIENAMRYFDRLNTIDKLVEFLKTSQEYAYVDRSVFINRIFN